MAKTLTLNRNSGATVRKAKLGTGPRLAASSNVLQTRSVVTTWYTMDHGPAPASAAPIPAALPAAAAAMSAAPTLWRASSLDNMARGVMARALTGIANASSRRIGSSSATPKNWAIPGAADQVAIPSRTATSRFSMAVAPAMRRVTSARWTSAAERPWSSRSATRLMYTVAAAMTP